MPILTVKALGEMLFLPLYQQLRILAAQKNPTGEPAVFQVPYYGPAIGAIRRYYRSGNDVDVVDSAITRVGLANYIQSKMDNNLTVLRAFRRGRQRRRTLTPMTAESYAADLAGLDLKFSPDLIASESGRTKYIIYNARAVAPSPQTARTILDLACFVLGANDIDAEPRDVELVSIREDQLTRIGAVRKSSIARARQNASAIIRLWPTL